MAALSPDLPGRGVRVGMTLAHAQALVSHAATAAFDPPGDQEALRRLAQWSQRFSPAVALDPPDGLLLDITGCERLFHGESNLLDQVARAIEAFGITVRAAIADTLGAAWAVARAGEEACRIVPTGMQFAALAHLPPWALRIGPEAAGQLSQLGIERIEALLMLPRSSLPSRFGGQLPRRIDQALGREPEPITPLPPPPSPSVEMEFEDGVRDRGVLMAAVRTLLEALTVQLHQRGCGARRIDLALWRERRLLARRSVTLCGPSRSPKHLAMLLEHELERTQVAGGVDAVQVAAPETGSMSPEQGEFFENDGMATAGESAELFDRLAMRLGAERVVRPVPVESHVPERAWNMGEATKGRSDGATKGEMPGAMRRNVESFSFPPSLCRSVASSLYRPLRLLPHPQPMQAMAVVPDQPPVWMRYEGRAHRIHRGFGPERICGEWWRDDGDARDYYRVETEAGIHYWVFRRESSGEWFVHGMFE